MRPEENVNVVKVKAGKGVASPRRGSIKKLHSNLPTAADVCPIPVVGEIPQHSPSDVTELQIPGVRLSHAHIFDSFFWLK